MSSPHMFSPPHLRDFGRLSVCIAIALVASACNTTNVSPKAYGVGRSGFSNWWREIGGPSLDTMVREALENSPAVEVLAARVEVARADARLLVAASQPSLSAGAARQFGKRQEFETGGEPADVMRFGGSARLAWELDFWGRVRQLRQGARRQVDAAFADEDAGRLVLISEITRLDLSRRRLAAEETVVADALEANSESVRRLLEKQRAGIIGNNLADRQSAEGDALRRDIDELRRRRRLAELALDRLIGREPGVVDWPDAPAMPGLPPLPDVVKTEVLANRPDIRAASVRVAASWHLSKAAMRDLLPKLRFTGLASGRSMRLSPSIDEWIAQVAPTIEVPIWDPVRRAKVGGSNARARLAAAEYREKVLRALEETAAALANLSAHENIRRSADNSAASLRAVYRRTQEKFASGIVSQLEVLEDQRRLLEAERAALQAKESKLAAWIDLKKALGG